MADRTLLRELFESWVERGEHLAKEQWSAPTRLGDWTVTDLYAHMAADRTAFRKLLATRSDKPPVATTGADVLRALNIPGGPAETLAPTVAERARAEAAAHTPADLLDNMRAMLADGFEYIDIADGTIDYVIGPVTISAVLEVAVVEATVHLLDLIAAVGGDPAPPAAVARACEIVLAVPDPLPLLEAATGRSTTSPFPVLR
ncbi:maleylpyruvate isomerase N-terminal domain-containing protein [Nocardia sp. NPDC127526]|uniref:maleylpyruvate isomerase N-terminal domain-containing protein n=1 Tax=Nocardia sp. NPDC127526 TaxID=3345393 RepID=UPI00363B6855